MLIFKENSAPVLNVKYLIDWSAKANVEYLRSARERPWAVKPDDWQKIGGLGGES